MANPTSLPAGVERTDSYLADGREIHYYDTQGQQRVAADRRPKEDLSPIGELRHNAVLDDWVAVAAHRQTRTFMPPKELCPLCPTAADATNLLTEIPEADYEVVVFDNRFPSLTRPSDAFTLPVMSGLQCESIEAAGKCEVVCFSSNHSGSFRELTPTQVRVVLEAWKDRTAALAALPDIQHVFPFENRGVEIGVTLPHPHGQIYGYSYLPIVTRQMLGAAQRYFAANGRVLLDDVVAREIADEIRIVARNDEWIAYVPFAARYPYEMHVAPLRGVALLTDLDEAASAAFADVYHEVLNRLDGVFGVEMPYIAAWHQAPLHEGHDVQRLHLQVTSIRRSPDKIKYLAGSESAMGAFISDVTPEQAAAQLREVVL
jgi:UDPglucose--hexose-1-phosphate uridylyltransferase